MNRRDPFHQCNLKKRWDNDNEKYKESGLLLELEKNFMPRKQSFDHENFTIYRMESKKPPVLYYQTDISFALYIFWLKEMNIPTELIQKIWITMVGKSFHILGKKYPRWNPGKQKMIMEDLLLKIN